MPIYDFKCNKCSHVFEQFRKFSDKEPECEKCGAPTKRQLCCPKASGILGDTPGHNFKWNRNHKSLRANVESMKKDIYGKQYGSSPHS